MNRPKVSVVIPTFNYAQFLPRAIDSVRTQSWSPLEIIVVDDGSADNTESLVAGFHPIENVPLTYIRIPNAGAAGARNLGIQKASGDFILPLDADDRLLPDGIALLMAPTMEDPSIDAVIGGCFTVDEKGRRLYRSAPALKPEREQNFRAYLENRLQISHGRFVVRKCFYEKVQYPVSFRISEDISVFAALLALCNTARLDHAVAEIYHHSISLRKNADFALEVGVKVVEAVFNPDIIPPKLFKYRSMFYAKRCLSIFRSLYRSGNFDMAGHYFRSAVRESFLSLFKWSYTWKYIRMRLNQLLGRQGRID